MTGDSLKLARLASQVEAGVIVFCGVHFLSPVVCMCSTMFRIDPQHFAWALENLAEGKVVNQIKVSEPDASRTRTALERMLAV